MCKVNRPHSGSCQIEELCNPDTNIPLPSTSHWILSISIQFENKSHKNIYINTNMDININDFDIMIR